ncbi:MAG: Lrp/AsnC family transcriptional regulator [Hyphomicrobium sp.]
MTLQIDKIDLRILKELMEDGSLTNLALAGKVGLSAPPCLRRVRALEAAGIIRGYTALVDEKTLGYNLVAYALVGLHNQTESDLRTFENRILGWSIVREAYMLSGESDYILKCIASDLAQFQEFVLKDLTAAPNVSSVKTSLTIRLVKSSQGVPLPKEL